MKLVWSVIGYLWSLVFGAFLITSLIALIVFLAVILQKYVVFLYSLFGGWLL